jgi:hypothetical protein
MQAGAALVIPSWTQVGKSDICPDGEQVTIGTWPGNAATHFILTAACLQRLHGAGYVKTPSGLARLPNFEPYRLAELEKSQKFSLCAAIRDLSQSFRTAST